MRDYMQQDCLPVGDRIPIIDLSFSDQVCAAALKEAFLRNGFFYVINHGVSKKVIDDEFEQNRKLFGLREEIKAQLVERDTKWGYVPWNQQALDPKHQRVPDTKEGYHVSMPVACLADGKVEPCSAEQREADAAAAQPWPHDEHLPEFRKATEAYFQGVAAVALRLVRLVAISLELPADYFDNMFDEQVSYLRPLHYAAVKSVPEQGVMAAGAHTDWGVLTLLATDSTPGLQVWHKKRWIDVPPMAYSFIVNGGDMLERWTNGLFKSPRHRVCNLYGTERFSAPFFLNPNLTTVLRPLECCCRDRPIEYTPISVGQFLLEKLSVQEKAMQEAALKQVQEATLHAVVEEGEEEEEEEECEEGGDGEETESSEEAVVTAAVSALPAKIKAAA